MKREITWFQSLPDEAKGNAIVLAFMVICILGLLFCDLLCDLGVFALVFPVKLALPIMILWLPILILVIHNRSIIEKNWLKYYLLIAVLIVIGFLCTKLFFHTTLMLVIPMVLMGCYRSRKMSILCSIGTAILVAVTPILAYKFHGLGRLFTAWYTCFVNPALISAEGQALIQESIHVTPLTGILLFESAPRLIILACFFVLSFCGSYLSRRSYEKKVENILRIQNNALDVMAEIIENRDTNTGGHVKRTRYVVGYPVLCARSPLCRCLQFDLIQPYTNKNRASSIA